MKRTLVACLVALGCTLAGTAQQTYKDKQSYKDWPKLAAKLDSDFFTTQEALRIGDNVLLYQQTTGGWPKNIYIPAELTEEERRAALAQKDDVNESTIDNKATTTEIAYLSRLYNATGIAKYKDAAIRGIRYLFEAQYDNGGWPQFYPRPKGYYTHITYNDDAMTNVLKLLRDVSKGKAPYAYLPEDIRRQAKASLDKGVDCILKTQVRQNGKLTAWCAQHDEHTLAPAKARAYELRHRALPHVPLQALARNHRQRGRRRGLVPRRADRRAEARDLHRRRGPERLPHRALPGRRGLPPAVGPLLHLGGQPPLLLRPRRHHALRPQRDRPRTPQRLQLVQQRRAEGVQEVQGVEEEGGEMMSGARREETGHGSYGRKKP